MSAKRKRGDEPTNRTDLVQKPVPGTKSFPTGVAVRNGLATGTRQGELSICPPSPANPPALVSFHQQILTPNSALPLPITHATVLIIQHYLDASPTADEIFNAWKSAEEVSSLALVDIQIADRTDQKREARRDRCTTPRPHPPYHHTSPILPYSGRWYCQQALGSCRAVR